MAEKSPIEFFADFIAGLDNAEIPEGARHHARRCVLDWFAAAVPGAFWRLRRF